MSAAFFEALREGVSDKFASPLWTLRDKRSHYALTVDAAAKIAAANTEDLYVAASFIPADLRSKVGVKKRPHATQAAGIYGFWADIDVKGTPDSNGKPKEHGADDEAHAVAIANLIASPTLVVRSGYGVQAWWLFEEPWIFGSEDDRKHAELGAWRWIEAHRQKSGVPLDATHDLNRLLRVPGTVNTKGRKCDPPLPDAPVSVDGDEGPRHDATALAALVAHVTGEPSSSVDLEVDVAVTKGATPPDKLEALRENNPMFDATWKRERADHPTWTPSSYCLSIASFCVGAEWTDQEIADTLIFYRAQYGDDPKYPAWFARTIARARSGSQEAPERESSSVEPHPQSTPPAPSTPGFDLRLQDWSSFMADVEGDAPPCLVDGLLVERSLTFLASQPKEGKTWIAQHLALCIATGKPFLSRFHVPRPRPVIYVLLEGSRHSAAVRLHALARGVGVDPGQGVENLHVAFMPRSLDIATPEHTKAIAEQVKALGAGLVIFDVLRNAASIPESGEGAVIFGAIRRNLEAVREAGAGVLLVHHFKKTTKESKGASLHERMTGTGALAGAMDAGFFITKSERGATALTIEVQSRDLPAPDPIMVALTGERTGPYGGWGRDDACYVTVTTPIEAPEPTKLDEIAAYVSERAHAQPGEIVEACGISDGTLRNYRDKLAKRGVQYVAAGKQSTYVAAADADIAKALFKSGFEGVQQAFADPASDPAPRNPVTPRNGNIAGSNPSNGGHPAPRNPQAAGDDVAGSEAPGNAGDRTPQHPAPLRGGVALPAAATSDHVEEELIARLVDEFDATEVSR